MSGTKYDYAVSQLADQGVINPDAHMFFQQEFYQYEPDVVATVMTQLSLKTGLKEWGEACIRCSRIGDETVAFAQHVQAKAFEAAH